MWAKQFWSNYRIFLCCTWQSDKNHWLIRHFYYKCIVPDKSDVRMWYDKDKLIIVREWLLQQYYSETSYLRPPCKEHAHTHTQTQELIEMQQKRQFSQKVSYIQLWEDILEVIWSVSYLVIFIWPFWTQMSNWVSPFPFPAHMSDLWINLFLVQWLSV